MRENGTTRAARASLPGGPPGLEKSAATPAAPRHVIKALAAPAVGLMRATRAAPPRLTGRIRADGIVGAAERVQPLPGVVVGDAALPADVLPAAAVRAIWSVLTDDPYTGRPECTHRIGLARAIAAELARRGLLAP